MGWTKFKDDLLQQELKGRWPLPSAVTVFPVAFSLAFLCICIGIAIRTANYDVMEKAIPYSERCSRGHCVVDFQLDTAMEGSLISTLYEIRNFPATHRKFNQQICLGQSAGVSNWEFSCESLPSHFFDVTSFNWEDFRRYEPSTSRHAPNRVYRLPLGMWANIMFNDTFKLWYRPYTGFHIEVILSKEGILTRADKSSYLKQDGNNYERIFNNTEKPRFWSKSVFDLEDGLQNVDLVVWMRAESRDPFRKIYRYIDLEKMRKFDTRFEKGLPAGEYQLIVENNWALETKCDEKGEKVMKSFILLKPSWYGNKDVYFHVICLVVGILYLVVGVVMLLIHKRMGKSLEEMSEMKGEEEHWKKK